MLSGLLCFLLGNADPLRLSTDFAFCQTPVLAVRLVRVKLSPVTTLVVQATKAAEGERDCLDEGNDTSDESSSPKQRLESFGGALDRHAQALFRTRLRHRTEKPNRAALALFYAFCTLLL